MKGGGEELELGAQRGDAARGQLGVVLGLLAVRLAQLAHVPIEELENREKIGNRKFT